MNEDFTKFTDSELYKFLCKDSQKKEKAFREIYARHSNRIYAYCRRVVGDRNKADDLFQDTFLRLLQSSNEEKEMTNLSGYMIKIARNLCLKYKTQQNVNLVSIEDFEIAEEGNELERTELSNLISMALDLLQDEYREALVLQAYDGMSYAEIAEIQEVPVTTVRNWIVRAKQRLKEILTPYLIEYRK
jgi:RNA polymerase sigma-70 factor (ECF subfamily)